MTLASTSTDPRRRRAARLFTKRFDYYRSGVLLIVLAKTKVFSENENDIAGQIRERRG